MLVSTVLTSEEDERVSDGWGYSPTAPVLSQLRIERIWAGIEMIGAREWNRVLLLSRSLDDLWTTLGECLGRTRWSSPLNCTTYLYYFYKWLYTTSPRSHVLSRMFYNHMTCHVIWLLKFPCYLYLVFVVWLDICDQVFECIGNFLLLRALITVLKEDWWCHSWVNYPPVC